jgi:hypothetical protein
LQLEPYSCPQQNSGKPSFAISLLTCCYQLIDLPLSVISNGYTTEMDELHILALAAETGFLHLKSRFPLNAKIKYQRLNAKSRPLDLSHLRTCRFSLDGSFNACL